MEKERGGETDGDLTDLRCLGRTEEEKCGGVDCESNAWISWSDCV